MPAFSILLKLVCAHAVCDYPLQGDFLAKGKNRFAPLPGVPWYQCLAAHAAIHAGAVLLITGMPVLAICEFVAHCLIDHWKCWCGSIAYEIPGNPYCNARLLFNVDQMFHVLCKVMWLMLLMGRL